ncbi:MAG: ribosomal-processing cysteine protease Prp [Clostridiales bacterium]|nr:ribosomal-processing cysteine protease Prp [Clostridia bacterium]MCD8055942.1 ribosomal-processing cysteine protease Prp [Clostridiales bacterium]
MTRITFFKQGDIYYGFEEHGHTGYGDSGEDILCSAISAMTMLVINALEISYQSDVSYSFSDEGGEIKLVAKDALPKYCGDEIKQYAVAGLIGAYFYQLMDLTEEYYDYLSVTEKEISPEKV